MTVVLPALSVKVSVTRKSPGTHALPPRYLSGMSRDRAPSSTAMPRARRARYPYWSSTLYERRAPPEMSLSEKLTRKGCTRCSTSGRSRRAWIAGGVVSIFTVTVCGASVRPSTSTDQNVRTCSPSFWCVRGARTTTLVVASGAPPSTCTKVAATAATGLVAVKVTVTASECQASSAP